MSEYLESIINTVQMCDCYEIIKKIPNKSVVVITDPPFGIGIDHQKKQVCKNPKHNRKELKGGVG